MTAAEPADCQLFVKQYATAEELRKLLGTKPDTITVHIREV